MIPIFMALAPVFLLIMLGYGMRQKSFPGDSFWPMLERTVFYMLLPCLFFKTMATADLHNADLLVVMAAAVALLVFTMAALVFGRKMISPCDGASYSSIIQGTIRFNNYVGLPVTLSLFGHDGLVVYAFIIAAMIPLTNVAAVWALAHYAHETENNPAQQPAMNWRNLLERILTNPLIISTIAGIFTSLSGIGLPPVVREVITAMADASLPMGLLAIGAGLDLSAIRNERRDVSTALVLKLLMYPALALGIGVVFGLDALALNVLVLFAALPTATSSFILASQMGGNAKLMANITASETLAAFLIMPLWLWGMMQWFG